MLVLAVHTVEAVTAKVPFAVILLQDMISNKKVPPEFKCRQMVPSSGSRSTSMWECTSPEELLQWLNDNINVDCHNEVYEVQEEFAIGLGEIQRQRAAERALASTRDAADKTYKAVGEAATNVDNKLKISETFSTFKESQVAKNTAAVLTKAGSTVAEGGRKIMANETVAKGTEAVGQQFKRLSTAISNSFGRRGREEESGGLTPSFVDSPVADQPFKLPNSGDAHLASPPAAVVQPSQRSAPSAAKFTLDDDHQP